jgi:hypothetical protein
MECSGGLSAGRSASSWHGLFINWVEQVRRLKTRASPVQRQAYPLAVLTDAEADEIRKGLAEGRPASPSGVCSASRWSRRTRGCGGAALGSP